MPRYGIIIEQAEGNLSAYVPDVPGCVTTGRTVEEVRSHMREALTLHLRGLLRDNDPIPEGHDIVLVDQPEVMVTFLDVELPSSPPTSRTARSRS
jgi:predicted RNase H-like HicB family nuclease